MRPTLHLYIRKLKLYFEAGWFKGENLSLLGIEILAYFPDIRMLIVFGIQVAKFSIQFGIKDW